MISNPIIQFLTSQKTKTKLSLLAFFILSIGVVTTIYLVNQEQDIRQRAQFATTLSSCVECSTIGLDDPYLCRASVGQYICQPKDVSDAFPGMVCIQCQKIIDEKTPHESSVRSWWKSLKKALNIDFNGDGKINGKDFKSLTETIKTFFPQK